MPIDKSKMDAKPEDLLSASMQADILARIDELAKANATALAAQTEAVKKALAGLVVAQGLQRTAVATLGIQRGPNRYQETEESLESQRGVETAWRALKVARQRLVTLQTEKGDLDLLARQAKRGARQVIQALDERLNARVVGGGARTASAQEIRKGAEGRMGTIEFRVRG